MSLNYDTDEAGIYTKGRLRTFGAKPGPLHSEEYGSMFVKELKPRLDFSRIIGSEGKKLLYSFNGLKIEYACLKSPNTSGDHKKSTGMIKFAYSGKTIAYFDVKRGESEKLYIEHRDFEQKIESCTGDNFYKIMRKIYEKNL